MDHATALMKTHLQAAHVEQHQRLHQNSVAPVMLANSTEATAKSNHAGNRLVCRLRAISRFMAAAKIAPESTRSRPRREASFTSGSTQTGAATIATMMLTASLAMAIASSGASMARLATTSSSSTCPVIQAVNCRTVSNSSAPQNSDSTVSLARRGMEVLSFIFRIQRIAQAVAHEVQAQQRACQEASREQQAPRREFHLARALVHQHAPGRGRLLHAKSKKAEEGFDQDHLR